MPTASHTATPLQRFVDDELSRTDALVDRTLAGTLEQLTQPRDGMLTADERQHYRTLIDALKRTAPQFRREFAQQLHAFVHADLTGAEAPAPDGTSETPGGLLQLMDETRIESDIEISRAAQLIDGSAEWELRELQTFVSTLAGQKHVDPESNPLRPLSYARALWAASGAVTSVPVQRGLVVRIAAGVMSGQLKKAWAAACTRLEDQGVMPGIYRTVVLPPAIATGSRPPALDVSRAGSLESLLATMPMSPNVPGSAPTAATLELALRNLGAMRRRAETSAARPALTSRDSLPGSSGALPPHQSIELVSRLFEAALADSGLPTALHGAVARLQVSALRIALDDADLIGSHDHAMWGLLNRMALAGDTYAQATDPRLAALAGFCGALADRMARSPVDPQACSQALQSLDAFLDEQLRQQQSSVQASIDALALAERRDDLERELSRRLTEQMAPIRTVPAIRRFVTGAWARVLADAMLRFGEKVEPTTGYLHAVDELLWTLRLPDHPQSRQRLIAVLPGLLKRLRAGMAQIALPEADQQTVLDALMVVHTAALKPGGTDPAGLSAEQIVQRLREELVDSLPLRAAFSDSLIDVSSLDTVPADALTQAAASADDPTRRVDALAPGDRLRLFIQGRWTRTQLLWRSPRGGYFLFVGESPTRTHSMTRRALERLCEERLAPALGVPTLVQRAVDRMLRKMAG